MHPRSNAIQRKKQEDGPRMGIQIGAKPDSGFDDPIEMLKDCHRRIENFLRILCVVVERAAGRAMTDEEAAAVKSALHYFRVGGQRHTADEEESLFPRLRAESAAGTLEELARLESDHQTAGDLHAAVDTLYTEWTAAGALSLDDEQRLLSATRRLKTLYEEHIQVEERVVFPLAAELLDSLAIADIGSEFRKRRE
jgi:hemerythrin-like domain-containing protein